MNNALKRRVTNPLINFLGRRRANKRFTDSPIIIGGCARTGTSLLVSILAAHSKIFAFPAETGVFSNWQYNGNSNDDSPAYVPERMDRLHRYILSHPIPKSVTRWCEKTPSNVRHIDKILAYFDNKVKFIHLIRDGRDVLTSRHPENPDDYWVSPERWIADTRAGIAFKDNSQVLTLKYEDLVKNHRHSLQTICEFLNEEFNPEFIHWYEHSNVRKNRAWFQPLQQLHHASIGKWKKPEHNERINQIMGNKEVVRLLDELNYDTQ